MKARAIGGESLSFGVARCFEMSQSTRKTPPPPPPSVNPLLHSERDSQCDNHAMLERYNGLRPPDGAVVKVDPFSCEVYLEMPQNSQSEEDLGLVLFTKTLEQCSFFNKCRELNNAQLNDALNQLQSEQLKVVEGVDRYKKLVAKVPHTALFWRKNQSQIGDAISRGNLSKFRSTLQKARTIIVVGRASSIGRSETNYILAGLRASNVRRYIREEFKIALEIPILVYGEEALYLSPNDEEVANMIGVAPKNEDVLNQSAWIYASERSISLATSHAP